MSCLDDWSCVMSFLRIEFLKLGLDFGTFTFNFLSSLLILCNLLIHLGLCVLKLFLIDFLFVLICCQLCKLLSIILFDNVDNNWLILKLNQAVLEQSLLPFEFIKLLLIILNFVVNFALKHVEVRLLRLQTIFSWFILCYFLAPVYYRFLKLVWIRLNLFNLVCKLLTFVFKFFVSF